MAAEDEAAVSQDSPSGLTNIAQWHDSCLWVLVIGNDKIFPAEPWPDINEESDGCRYTAYADQVQLPPVEQTRFYVANGQPPPVEFTG